MAKFDERYFGESQPYDVENMLSENEQVVWRGKPNKKAFIMSQVFRMLPFAVIWLIFDSAFIAIMFATGAVNEIPPLLLAAIGVFFLLHLTPVWIWLYNVLTAAKRQQNTEYVFTDSRIIIKSGVIGVDVVNIYYADVSNVNVRVGLSDKIFKVGDIYITGTFKAQVLWDVEKPYEVATALQKVVHDIKTDTYFPNELRPDVNRGYETRYTPDDKGFKDGTK